MTKQIKYALIAGLVVVCALLIALVFLPKTAAHNQSLVQCLAEKGVVMYGSDMCDECKNQKKILGDEFKDINYFNCDFNSKECNEKGITVYPVWSYGNKVLVGVQSVDNLSVFAECPFQD
jgi:hypothetical protein